MNSAYTGVRGGKTLSSNFWVFFLNTPAFRGLKKKISPGTSESLKCPFIFTFFKLASPTDRTNGGGNNNNFVRLWL